MPKIDVATYSEEGESLLLAMMLAEEGTLYQMPVRGYFRIAAKGFVAAEALDAPRSASPQGFIAMSFHASMTAAFTHGFDPALRAAGYRAMRIDNKEHSSAISDEILSEIRRSRFVVADYTKQNNGVYFEAGFAQGLGIQVIPTCRSNEIGNLHFDVRHINTLAWDEPADLAIKLARRISAVMGDGPLERTVLL